MNNRQYVDLNWSGPTSTGSGTAPEQPSLFEEQEKQDAARRSSSAARAMAKAPLWDEIVTTWRRLHEAEWEQGDIADALYDLVEELVRSTGKSRN